METRTRDVQEYDQPEYYERIHDGGEFHGGTWGQISNSILRLERDHRSTKSNKKF